MKNLLLKPDMLEAFVKGRKTHTRELFGLNEVNENPDRWECMPVITTSWQPKFYNFFRHDNFDNCIDVKPRYRKDEVVSVGEAYCYESEGFAIRPRIRYKAGGIKEAKLEDIPLGVTIYNYLLENYPDCIKWRSPSSMPAWAARYHARITSVGCGRLQNMTFEDCLSEGIMSLPADLIAQLGNDWEPPKADGKTPVDELADDLESNIKYIFAKRWDKINPKYPASLNPWTIDYGIERVEL